MCTQTVRKKICHIKVKTKQMQKTCNSYEKVSKDSARTLMKGETYIYVETSTNLTSITYSFYETNQSQYYEKGKRMYSITYNRFFEAIVSDKNYKVIGIIRGRGGDWNYEDKFDNSNDMNVVLSFFPSLDAHLCDMRMTFEDGTKYKLKKPKARGWSRFVLDFDYLNTVFSSSLFNFKVVSCGNEERLHMIAGKLKRRSMFDSNKYHIITNFDTLQASILFFFKSLG